MVVEKKMMVVMVIGELGGIIFHGVVQVEDSSSVHGVSLSR